MRLQHISASKMGASLLVLMLTVAVAVFVGWPRLKRYECRRHLSCIHYALMEYASEHDGQLPTSLRQISGKGRAVVFMCPSEEHAAESGAATVDYAYIKWPELRMASDMPVVFDGSPAHHRSGVNVLMLSGRKFWDSHCAYLRTFFRQHPDISWEYRGNVFTGVEPRVKN